MEELDGMIMKTLASLGCSFCKDVDCLSLLGVDDIVEGIVRLLWACDESYKVKIPQLKLPGHMTGRYKTSTAIAEAVKGLGIREKVGYHTLLYPNVYDIRNIFIFLIENLPKHSFVEDVELSNFDKLKQTIGFQVREDLNEEWVPGYCNYLRMVRKGIFWAEPDTPFLVPFSTKNYSDRRFDFCRFLEDSGSQDFSVDDLIPKDVKKRPVPLPKPRLKMEPSSSVETKPEDTVNSTPNAEIEKLNAQNEQLNHSLITETNKLLKLRQKQDLLDNRLSLLQSDYSARNEKLIQLLNDPETHLPKATAFLEEGQIRRNVLEEKFKSWLEENMQILEQLKEEKGLNLSNDQTNEIKDVNDKIKTTIQTQKQILHRLKKHHEKSESKESDERSRFLSRIAYLANNINAQKNEVTKSFEAYNHLLKERKQLLGSLGRTFTVVEMWLSQASEKDLTLKNAYDSLVKMHSLCADVVKTIMETTEFNKQADEYQDEVEVLKQQSVDDALDQMLNDLVMIQEENNNLELQLNN